MIQQQNHAQLLVEQARRNARYWVFNCRAGIFLAALIVSLISILMFSKLCGWNLWENVLWEVLTAAGLSAIALGHFIAKTEDYFFVQAKSNEVVLLRASDGALRPETGKSIAISRGEVVEKRETLDDRVLKEMVKVERYNDLSPIWFPYIIRYKIDIDNLAAFNRSEDTRREDYFKTVAESEISNWITNNENQTESWFKLNSGDAEILAQKALAKVAVRFGVSIKGDDLRVEIGDPDYPQALKDEMLTVQKNKLRANAAKAYAGVDKEQVDAMLVAEGKASRNINTYEIRGLPEDLQTFIMGQHIPTGGSNDKQKGGKS